jgi:hypothetical protein
VTDERLNSLDLTFWTARVARSHDHRAFSPNDPVILFGPS